MYIFISPSTSSNTRKISGMFLKGINICSKSSKLKSIFISANLKESVATKTIVFDSEQIKILDNSGLIFDVEELYQTDFNPLTNFLLSMLITLSFFKRGMVGKSSLFCDFIIVE